MWIVFIIFIFYISSMGLYEGIIDGTSERTHTVQCKSYTDKKSREDQVSNLGHWPEADSLTIWFTSLPWALNIINGVRGANQHSHYNDRYEIITVVQEVEAW